MTIAIAVLGLIIIAGAIAKWLYGKLEEADATLSVPPPHATRLCACGQGTWGQECPQGPYCG